MLLYQSIGIALITLLAYSHPVFGYSQLDRPIVTGFLVGVVMGDIKTGVIIGAGLELIYIGTATIGGALPPDYCAGGILAAAFAIATKTGLEGAVTLSLPIATLVLLVKNFLYAVGRGYYCHKADKYAAEGNIKGVERTHWLAAYIAWVPLAVICGAGFYLGSDVIASLLAAIPEFITKGISAATAMLPALGLAMLAKFLNNKKLIPFFFIGFLAASYLGISVLGIACFAIAIALLITTRDDKKVVVEENGGEDDDF